MESWRERVILLILLCSLAIATLLLLGKGLAGAVLPGDTTLTPEGYLPLVLREATPTPTATSTSTPTSTPTPTATPTRPAGSPHPGT